MRKFIKKAFCPWYFLINSKQFFQVWGRFLPVWSTPLLRILLGGRRGGRGSLPPRPRSTPSVSILPGAPVLFSTAPGFFSWTAGFFSRACCRLFSPGWSTRHIVSSRHGCTTQRHWLTMMIKSDKTGCKSSGGGGV